MTYARPRAVGPATLIALSSVLAACPHSAPLVPDAAPPVAATTRRPEVAMVVYDGGLKDGWQDWGWAPHDVRGPGPATVRFNDYGGLILAHPGLKGDFGGVMFRVKEPPGEGEFLEVHLLSPTGRALPKVKLVPNDDTDAGGGWTEVFISMDRLDPDGLPFDRIVFQSFRPFSSEWVPIDKVALTQPPPGPSHVAKAYDAKALPQVTLTVDCHAKARKISPYIYGINYYAFNDEQKQAAQWLLGATARRWGGNTASTYNRDISAWNTGNDYFFENHDVPSYTVFLKDNADHGMASALTVPIMGWVSKDKTSSSFPVSVFGAQEATDPYRSDAGNGKAKGSGKLIPPGPATRAYVQVTPEYVKRWVEAIRQADAKTGKRSVWMYILDNEPMLWNANHRDAHPDPLSYDELVDRTIAFGTAIRQADPGAIIAGPASWGWTGYMYSAKDMANGGPAIRPDRRAHGDLPVIAYYLKALAEHERRTGVRVLDVLDLHSYAYADRVSSDASDPAVAALRVRTTRMLWDPDYVDESWVKEPVQILPRMRRWIDENYPGRGMSLGEWNFGGEEHTSGALAVAEALGRFAQYGLTSAFYWTYPPANSPVMWAFRAYRNYDGKGGHFLDWFTQAQLAGHDAANASAFVSRDDSGKHLVVVALNTSRQAALAANVDLSSCGNVASAQVYAYSGGATGLLPSGSPDRQASPQSKLVQVLPPYTISVIDVQLSGATAVTK